MTTRNKYRYFDVTVREKLGIYVYVLIDPRMGRVFYVGKGGGKFDLEGRVRGNARLFDHFFEAENSARRSKKIQTILEIWESGRDVEWGILRYGLPDEKFAFLVEASTIDALEFSTNLRPDNDQGGHETIGLGLRTSTQVIAMAAPLVNPTFPCTVFIFHIEKGLADRRKQGLEESSAIYGATRELWELPPRLPQSTTEGSFAVGLVDKVSYGAFGIARWNCHLVDRRDKDTNQIVKNKNGTNRKAKLFSFDKDDTVSVDQLLMKNWKTVVEREKGFWKRAGGKLVVAFDGAGHYETLYPRRDVKQSCL